MREVTTEYELSLNFRIRPIKAKKPIEYKSIIKWSDTDDMNLKKDVRKKKEKNNSKKERLMRLVNRFFS